MKLQTYIYLLTFFAFWFWMTQTLLDSLEGLGWPIWGADLFAIPFSALFAVNMANLMILAFSLVIRKVVSSDGE